MPRRCVRPAAASADGMTRNKTREFFRIVFHDESLVTEHMVDETSDDAPAIRVHDQQDAGGRDRGSLTEAEVHAVKAPTRRSGQLRRAREFSRRRSTRGGDSWSAQDTDRRLRTRTPAGKGGGSDGSPRSVHPSILDSAHPCGDRFDSQTSVGDTVADEPEACSGRGR